ncbi:MAG: fumarylacetoacetate hydrolase family protein [Aggregatilineales bacterium]
MILLTFRNANGQMALGVKTAKGVLDVAAAAAALGHSEVAFTPSTFYTVGSVALGPLQRLVEASAGRADLYHDETALTLGPPVPNPGKIICIGLNYLRHAAESGAAPPPVPLLFSKFGNAIAASNEPVPLPAAAKEVDYEAELCVVMGRRARYVSEANALDCVLGYCNANDVSARDLQMRTSQWLLGKTLDKFLPIGPYLVTADEAGDPNDMPVRGWLNGELRQDSSTADMIFNVAQIISYTSQYMTLEPGDIISTGTPEGVILGMKDKVWLKPGDEYAIEIGKLGRLVNRFVSEDSQP